MRTSDAFAQHLQLAPHLADRVDAFRRQHFDGYAMIGVHIRGGQGAIEFGQPALPMEVYLEEAERLRDALVSAARAVRFFVASNVPDGAKAFSDRFGSDAVLTSGAPTIGSAAEDLDNGNGVVCTEDNADSRECAKRNAEGIIVDVWLLSMCDHYVYWRTSTSLLPLLRNAKLIHHRIGPPITELSPDTNFALELKQDAPRHRALIGSSQQSAEEQWLEAQAAILEPRREPPHLPGCRECDAVLRAYGLSSVSAETWDAEALSLARADIDMLASSSSCSGDDFACLLRSAGDNNWRQRWSAAMLLSAVPEPKRTDDMQAAVLEVLRDREMPDCEDWRMRDCLYENMVRDAAMQALHLRLENADETVFRDALRLFRRIHPTFHTFPTLVRLVPKRLNPKMFQRLMNYILPVIDEGHYPVMKYSAVEALVHLLPHYRDSADLLAWSFDRYVEIARLRDDDHEVYVREAQYRMRAIEAFVAVGAPGASDVLHRICSMVRGCGHLCAHVSCNNSALYADMLHQEEL